MNGKSKPYSVILTPARVKRKGGQRFASLDQVSDYLARRFVEASQVVAEGLRGPHGVYQFQGFAWADLPPLVSEGVTLYDPGRAVRAWPA